MSRLALLVTVLALGLGIGVGYWLAGDSVELRKAPAESEPMPLYYRHPMDPSVTSPVPALRGSTRGCMK